MPAPSVTAMSDPAFDATSTFAVPPPPATPPYRWSGLVVSILALIVIALLIWFLLAALVFLVEIPVEGWSAAAAHLGAVAAFVGERGPTSSIFIPFPLVIGALEPDTPAVENGITIVTMLLQLSLIAAVFIIAYRHAGARWRDALAWHPWEFRRHAVLFGLLLVAALAFNEIGGLITKYFWPGPSEESVPAFGPGFALFLLGSVVAAPFMEELLVRGWLYTGLRSKLSAWPTILITAVLFAVLHSLSSPREILTTLPLGLAASYLRECIGSVRAPIAFHSAHNAIVCALLLVG
jgi:uncharacterized protein